MKMARKMIKYVILMIIIASMFSISFVVEGAVKSGACGDSIAWSLNDSGTLTLKGSGPMRDYVGFPSGVKKVNVGEGITTIGHSAFYGLTDLTEVNLPKSLSSIGDKAFTNCSSLEEINIPSKVSNIGYVAFLYCQSLTNINVDSKNNYYCSIDGVLYNKNKTELIKYPEMNQKTVYYMPSSVTKLHSYAFDGAKNLENIYLSKNLTTLSESAFSDCENLKSIMLYNKITKIGSCTFRNCTSLTKIVVPKSVVSVDGFAFWASSNLTYVYYEGSKSDWDNIDINKDYNFRFSDAVKTYNYVHKCKIETQLKKATTSNSGLIKKWCSLCGSVKSSKTINKISSISISKKNFNYDGNVKSPKITVKDSKGHKLVNNTDYKIYAPSGRKSVGTYTYTVRFKGNYSGSKNFKITINPKNTSITKIYPLKNGFKLEWKKTTKQVSGYQVQYSTNSKFKSSELITLNKNKQNTLSEKKLKSKQKYYVRIRTYKFVDGKRYYSNWSNTKTVKTKK